MMIDNDAVDNFQKSWLLASDSCKIAIRMFFIGLSIGKAMYDIDMITLGAMAMIAFRENN